MTKKYFTSLIFLFSFSLSISVYSQNLVNNPGFETLGSLYSHTGAEKGEMNALMKNWAHLEFSFPCNCENKYYLGDIRSDINDNCKLVAPKAFNGCNMSLLWAGYTVDNDKVHGAYIYTKLNQTLKIGKIYEISCWYYISADTSNQYVREIISHIGCNLTNAESDAMARNVYSYLSDFPYWFLLLKNPPIKTWFQQKWYIRPTCELNFLIFGETTDDNWSRPKKELTYYTSFKYFIVDVSVLEVDSQLVADQKIVPISFCKPKPSKKSKNIQEDFSLYFSSGSSTLDDSNKMQLDTLVKILNQHKDLIISFDGHTDDIGKENQNLSEMRAKSVVDYLVHNNKINKLRLLTRGLADKIPAIKGNDEFARSKNRRVEIRFTQYDIHEIFYSEALRYIERNNFDSAFIFINKWVNVKKNELKIFSLFDSRLEPIKSSAKWKAIELKIREEYRKYKKSEDSFFWDSMYCVDQRYRTLEQMVNGLGVFADTPEAFIPLLDSINFYNHEENSRNIALQKIEKSGFPKSSEVGERAASAAFYFIQHSDTLLMKQYLPTIEQYCKEGEFDWYKYMMMYDRIENRRGNPQLYCTQFARIENGSKHFVLYKHFPPEIVNAARAKLGVPPKNNFDDSFDVVGEELFKRK